MSLRHSYRQAEKILRHWPAETRPLLTHLCRRIQDAEQRLNVAAAQRLTGCLRDCRGLCCRNLHLDAVFGVPDFVYILGLAPALGSTIDGCLRHEYPLFTANCPFLERGVGPCLFPPDLRPEVCITSFCRGDEGLKPEIRRIKLGFWRLGFLTHFRRVPRVQRLLVRIG
jgi:hypothetical protein